MDLDLGLALVVGAASNSAFRGHPFYLDFFDRVYERCRVDFGFNDVLESAELCFGVGVSFSGRSSMRSVFSASIPMPH